MEKNKRIIGLIGAVIFSYGFIMVLNWVHNSDLFNTNTLVLGTTTLIIVLLVSSLFNKILQRITNSPVAQIRKKMKSSLIIFTLSTLVISFTAFFSGLYLFYKVEGLNTDHFIQRIFQKEFAGSIIHTSIGILTGIAIFFYTIWKQAVNRELRLREENLKYKYINLKTQVNPHFLFNSLNTLSELVYEDPKKADNYIQQLSGIYRYILEHEETDLIPLDEEAIFVKQYFDLQKERAGDKVQLNISINNADRYKVMPVSLQILVENALKHNSFSENNPLKISICKEDMFVVVSNNIQRKNVLDNSYGTGLSNLKERIKLVTGMEMVVNHDNDVFTVKIPIVSV
ncbi:sensor histidine kinase [Bacteroides sp. UBA939]|uniref:sensor histidine kinase n=1 Tax=Bacteroides sp. UBA939 TaxID=1946092 RepID=UPI0025B99DE8|nr:histidine kinase [Bacteroides sp. UBA939]